MVAAGTQKWMRVRFEEGTVAVQDGEFDLGGSSCAVTANVALETLAVPCSAQRAINVVEPVCLRKPLDGGT
jgi:hypothetical protein